MTAPTPTTVLTPREFEEQLVRFINGTLLGGAGSVDRDTRLFEDGYMNSLRILDLIAMVEKTLGKRVPDRAVRLANFRTIAIIVRTFHPDATVEPNASPDRLFERRTKRAQFASPTEALQRRGDLTIAGPGQVALTGLALDVLEAVDHTVVRWAQALGAKEHRYPSLIDVGVLERAGQHGTHVILSQAKDRDHPDRGTSAAALSTAVCYHAYPEWTGKVLASKPTLLSARGRCYRHEDANHIPLERLWEFTMREIIVMGTRQHVEDVRQSLVRQAIAFVETLDVDAAIETATDPFFVAGDDGRRLMQQAGALKYELRLTVDPGGRSIAAASFNHHHDFFGTRFDIRLPTDTPAHSGCVAFGLERWVLGLLAQHGVDERAWPDAMRNWLEESRPRARGVGV